MAHRLSRRPGPGHPALFDSEADIPAEPTRPDPATADALAEYGALLEQAGTMALAEAARCDPGREVVVAGRRHPVESGDADAVAVLDDGTARVRLTVANSASAALTSALQARLLLLTAHTGPSGDAAALRVSAALDLRRLGDEHRAAERSARSGGPAHARHRG